MKLSSSEKRDLFERYKDRNVEKLNEMIVLFKANKHFAKAEIIELIRKVKEQDDISGLKNLKQEIDQTGEWEESCFVDTILREKIETELEEKKKAKEAKREEKLEKKRIAKEKKKPSSKFGVSEKIYEAMVSKIKHDSKKHRERIDKLQSSKMD